MALEKALAHNLFYTEQNGRSKVNLIPLTTVEHYPK